MKDQTLDHDTPLGEATAGTALRFMTICARNFLPAARILADSVLQAHPDATFTVYLCDRDMGYVPEATGLDIVSLERLGIPALERMIRSYNITELCTAIKPYCFLHEFALAGDAATPPHVVYLDPDIELFSPLVEVAEALDAGAQAVLTPHVLGPTEGAEFGDGHFLRFGIYNLGFAAFRNTPRVAEVMRWWARKMIDHCVIDLPNGIFVDQKWMDLLPAFLDEVCILRHPGYNIAYWNLHERRIHGPQDALQCNGKPLRFVHYSGLVQEDTSQIARNSESCHLSNTFGYGPLVTRYRKRLAASAHSGLRKLPYAFFWNGAKEFNEHTPGEGTPHSLGPKTFMLARQFFDFEQFRAYKAAEIRETEHHRAVELAHVPKDRTVESFQFNAFCVTCGGVRPMATSFLYSVGFDASGGPLPNWREHIVCETCGLPNRVRAAMHLFLQEFRPAGQDRIYITEQKTPLYRWMAERFPRLTGSEYFGDAVPRGQQRDGVRNENLEALSFLPESFDHVLSLDVLEHVVDPARAFAEILRVLEPGGYLIFSASAHLDRHPTTTRAEVLPDGSIVHHHPPEIHGNPVDDEKGALCFRHYGWDVLDMMRDAGFRRPFLYHYWSREFGYFGADQGLFVAQKPQ